MICFSLQEALSYQYECDQEFIRRFRGIEADIVPSEALKLLSHIANAQCVWNRRIEGKEPEVGIWERHDLELLEGLERTNHRDSLRILSERDPEEKVIYRNSEGKAFSNRLIDILFHIVNHGTYHRGQIARIMRAHDIDPPVGDHVILEREEENG